MEHGGILARVFEKSTDGLFLLENGVFIDCNAAAISLLACSDKSDIIGCRPSDYSPKFQPDGSRSDIREHELMDAALKQGHICFEWNHQRVDGTILPVEILLIAIEYDGRDILYSNWRDITRRQQAEKALQYRRQLETLITHTSSYFINLPTDEIDAGIQQVLGDLGRFVEADRSYVFDYDDEFMHNRYEWCSEGIEPQIERMQNVSVDAMSWSNKRILRGEVLNIPVVEELPAGAQIEKDEFAVQKIKSILVVPMERRDQVVGFIGFDAVRQRRQWPEEVVDLLRIAAGIIANVLDRRLAEIELREMNRTLEARIQDRTRELEQRHRVAKGLRETLAVVNSSASLEETLSHITRQACTLAEASACILYSLDQVAQTGRVEVGVGIFEDEMGTIEFELDSTPGRELLSIFASKEPIAINYTRTVRSQIQADKSLSATLRSRRIELYEQFKASISVPLFVRDEPYGAITIYYETEQVFSDIQLRVATTLAEQAALAVENARLHQSEQERRIEAEDRRRIAEGLRDSLVVLNSNLSLDDILDFIVRQAVQMLGTRGGALYLLDEERSMLHVGASHGLNATYTALELPVGGAITGRAVALGEPVSVPDLQAASGLLDRYLREPNIPDGWISGLAQLTEQYGAVLSIPIRTHERVYGAMTLYYSERQQFTDDMIGLAVAFAGQAALVIENARLRERVRESAAIEERNRLARNLHDAVTQTLFSASLIADTLPDLWEIDRTDAQEQLDRLANLTRGALAEMRTLLIELRPAQFAQVDMHTLLQQLIDAAQGRSKVQINLSVHGCCDTDPDIKYMFYRIAQEALNNIIKHAYAQHAFISLRCDDQGHVLKVLDDGQGFDPDKIEAGHFGMQIMAERASSMGASFIVDTKPSEGTEIQVLWRKDE